MFIKTSDLRQLVAILTAMKGLVCANTISFSWTVTVRPYRNNSADAITSESAAVEIRHQKGTE